MDKAHQKNPIDTSSERMSDWIRRMNENLCVWETSRLCWSGSFVKKSRKMKRQAQTHRPFFNGDWSIADNSTQQHTRRLILEHFLLLCDVCVSSLLSWSRPPLTRLLFLRPRLHVFKFFKFTLIFSQSSTTSSIKHTENRTNNCTSSEWERVRRTHRAFNMYIASVRSPHQEHFQLHRILFGKRFFTVYYERERLLMGLEWIGYETATNELMRTIHVESVGTLLTDWHRLHTIFRS